MHDHIHRVAIGVGLDVRAVFHQDDNDNGHSPNQFVGAILGGYLGVGAPQGVEGDGQGEAQIHKLVQKVVGVVLEHLPGIAQGFGQLVAPLAQAEVEGQGKHGEIDPGGGAGTHNSGAVDHPQDEAHHQQHDVQKGDVLEPQTVAQIDCEVGQHEGQAASAAGRQMDGQSGGEERSR